MGILDAPPLPADRAGWQDGDIAVWDATEARFKRSDHLKRVATGESIMSSTVLATGNIANPGAGKAVSYGLFVAPFPCKVVDALVAAFGGNAAASNTNYWEIYLQRYSQAAEGSQTIATRTTRETTGEGFTQYKGWSWERQAFSNNILGRGDTCRIKFEAITGSAPEILGPVMAAIRLEEI